MGEQIRAGVRLDAVGGWPALSFRSLLGDILSALVLLPVSATYLLSYTALV
jgi:hypothetical protein